MSTSAREELLKIQKRLWKRNKEIIKSSIIVKEDSFTSYERKYNSAIANYERVATNDEMVAAIKEARITYVGDYHTCNQSQRSFLRILKAIVPENNNVIIGLELIHKRHQDILDAFIEDRLTEDTFQKKIGLKEHWVFDLWNNFKPVFDFAKYHHLPITGIDAAGPRATLKERDEATAKLIVKLAGENPDKKIFVMIGDLHLAHLPKIVRKFSQNKFSDLILFQNSDRIYWDLAKKDLEHRVEIVKISDNAFCRMHTPPLVCQQSYINWLEHEEGEIDFSDSRTSFLELLDNICKFLNIDLGNQREKVDVYTCGDLSFCEKLKNDPRFSPRELKILKRQIMCSESYFIPEKHVVYLANLSVNHAAEEATHFLKIECSGLEKQRPYEDAFYANILHEALAFFGSKLINPKRKCLHEKEFESLIAYLDTIRVPQDRRVEYETGCFVSQFLKRDGRIPRMKPDLFFSVTHALGYMLGDYLFYGMMGERISRDEIKELFYDPWDKEGEPLVAYRELRKRLKGVKIPKRM